MKKPHSCNCRWSADHTLAVPRQGLAQQSWPRRCTFALPAGISAAIMSQLDAHRYFGRFWNWRGWKFCTFWQALMPAAWPTVCPSHAQLPSPKGRLFESQPVEGEGLYPDGTEPLSPL
eukprot:scaffold671659_cov47-Prasinocladus_malaysianus.AAC.1